MTTYSPKVELYVNSAWTDVSTDVLYDGAITITRGRQDEGGQTQPSTCAFTLDNTSNNYSPENPTGTYYGSIERNVPCRASLPASSTRLILGPTTAGNANTVDSAALSIVGDIDLRGDIFLKSWKPHAGAWPIFKSDAYRLHVSDTGFLELVWNSDAVTLQSVVSTVRIPMDKAGRLSVRATLDVDNGAAGHTTTFYTSTTAGTAGPWTILGAAVVTAGVTVIYDSPLQLFVYSGAAATMECYSVAVYQGIAGTLRANPIFSAQGSGITGFADAQGNTWNVSADGRIDDRDYRFWGEVSEWPQKEDPSGRFRTVDVVAAGPTRRLFAGTAPVQSAMDRAIAGLTTAVAWWPGEDGPNSTNFASGIPGGPPIVVYGSPTFAGNDTKFPGCGALLVMDVTCRMRTYSFPSYTDTGATQTRFLLGVPTGGYLADIVIMRWYTTGTGKRWDLLWTAIGTGGFYLRAYDEAGTAVYTSGAASFDMIAKAKWVSVEWTQSGADVNWSIETLEVGQVSGGSLSGTAPGVTFGKITTLQVNWENNDMSDTVIGQILVQNTVDSIYSLSSQINAYSGENPDGRLKRLVTTEELLRFEYIGTVDVTLDSIMGFQRVKTLPELLRECELQDGGILTDGRSFNGLISYRTRDSMYGTDAVASLSYTGHDPYRVDITADDKNVANDITVTRTGGSSYRAQQATGQLNTAAPPTGVGSYRQDIELSLAGDLQARNHAGWRLHLGTVKEPRWPRLEIWAERSAVSDIQADLRAIDLGDRITVTDVPTRRLLWDGDLLVIGITETIDQLQWHLIFVTVPQRPWRVLEWNTDRRWSPDDSALNASLTSTATSFAVKTNSGSLWTTTDVPFDILVGGERMTVGAVAATASPQTFSSVTRSVNGVVKAHSADDQVTLWDPSYWAL